MDRVRLPLESRKLALQVVVKRGFTHDMADMLVDDLKRQLPRLERQPHPVHESSTASSFHH